MKGINFETHTHTHMHGGLQMHHSDANFRGYYILLCVHKTDPHAHPWKTVLSSHQKREIYEQGVGEELLTLEAKSAGRHV